MPDTGAFVHLPDICPNPAFHASHDLTTSTATQTPSSKFEVTVNRVLVHTKVGAGGLMPAGFPDSETKLAPVFAAISAALEGTD